MRKLILLPAAAILMAACTYADRRFVPQESAAEIQAGSRAIQASERAERAEYRKERPGGNDGCGTRHQKGK